MTQHMARINTLSRPCRDQRIADRIGAHRRHIGDIMPSAREVDGCVEGIAAITQPAAAMAVIFQHGFAKDKGLHDRPRDALCSGDQENARPPLMSMFAPVMNEASSEAR